MKAIGGLLTDSQVGAVIIRIVFYAVFQICCDELSSVSSSNICEYRLIAQDIKANRSLAMSRTG